MRIFVRLGAGFTAACLLGAYLLELWSLPLGILLGIGAVIFLCFRRKSLGFVGLGLAVGLIWFGLYSQFALEPARNADGSVKTITASAVDYSYDTGYGTAVEVELKLDGRKFGSKLYLDGNKELTPGDVIRGKFTLRYTGPRGEKESAYHSGSGVFLLGYQKGEVELIQSDGSIVHFPARFRKTVLSSIDRLFPSDTAAFAKALLLGDTTGIDYETDSALTASGIVHVVSVSGLHVSILFCVLFWFLGRRRFLTPILGVVLLVFVAAVTGFSASIVRSCLMNGLMLLALMLDREYDPMTALAFALFVMLAVNPMSVTSVGLQLSAASVLGIHLLAQRIAIWISARKFWQEVKYRGVVYHLREWIASTVGVSLAATLTTAPLTALHFGTVSLVGWLTNLLVLWLVNIVFVGIMISVILGAFWLWGGQGVAWLLSWGIRFVLAVAKLLGAFPLAVVYTESPYITAWLVFAYAMLAAFLLMKWKHRLQLCLWTAVTLAVAITLSWLEPALDDYRLTAIDVGQGQCMLLQSDGRTYMVDCGGSHDKTAADKAVATLHSQGIFRLDGLILTHYDRDHVGAVQYLLKRVPADTLYLPVGPGQEEWTPTLTEAASRLCYVEQDLELTWQSSKISIYSFGKLQTSNESSLCVLFQRENCDILITGDQDHLGEMALISQHHIPKLDVLVVGHHGSNKSTGEALLEHTAPSVAVISVGQDNAYGHPAQQVLERLTRFGCHIHRTDLEGTILIKG